MGYKRLFTSESVSEGHPDKVADQISDAIVDALLREDPFSRVACETLVTTGLVVLAGEIRTRANVDYQKIVRQTIREIGYTRSEYFFDADSCGITVALHSQSPDIAMGVSDDQAEELGAGDQGIMFGYAVNETPEYLPASLAYAHRLVKELARIRKEDPELMPYLRPDSKSQVTVEYDEKGKVKRIHTILVSTQHDPFERDYRLMQKKIREDVIHILIPRVIPEELIDEDTIIHVNPTGQFVIGGPHGDSGLTGRKIIVDTYGGRGAHGGGAFSGKDPTKVDRSATYAARHVAKNLVAAGIAGEVLIQVSYAIGIARPLSLWVHTFGTAKVPYTDEEIAEKLLEIFDLRPYKIIERLQLRNPIYRPTAAYGHMGREPYVQEVEVKHVNEQANGSMVTITKTTEKKQVKFFPWEELNYVEVLREAFKLT
jgi:S-adenosylmethionine synthetase